MPLAPWRQTVRILFVVHLVTSAGFSLVIPFLPLYVKRLGVGDPTHIAFWSGTVFAAPALTMMLAAPLWGWLADRYGRKMMLVRSTLAGAVILSLMGFVQNVEQLALLRAAQGALTGYIAASNALVAATIPRAHAGESFGFLRTGTWVGTGLGPLIGGLIGEHFGYRQSFWFTGILLGCAGLLVIFTIHEPFPSQHAQKKRSFLAAYKTILTTAGLPRIFSMSFVDSLGRSMVMPVLPLFMLALMGSNAGVATATGVLLGARAFSGSLASLYVGRLGDRIGHGRVVLFGALAMALLYLPQPFVTAYWQLITLQILTGLAAVGIIPGIGALMSLYVPEGSSGATFGLESSVDSLARVIGPMLGATVATLLGFRYVFGFVALAFMVVILLALPLMRVVAEKNEGNIPG